MGAGVSAIFCLALTAQALPAYGSTPAARPAWMDVARAPGERADALLARMTLDEKLAMVHGTGFVMGAGHAGHVPGNSRLGIPALYLADGPNGVGNGSTGVTAFPVAVNQAATWDDGLIRQYGKALGREQWGKGHNVALAPTVNLLRVPEWGRAFETFSEDPYLAARVGAAEIKGIQSQHVIATVKHFAANNQEAQRYFIDVQVSERALQELYFPAFKAAVKAGAGSVMCAYNQVNGDYSCENASLLNDTLKQSWGFKGFVMSDWFATHSTVKAANAGLDMEMPSGTQFGFPEYFTGALKQAVESGQVSTATLDDKVRRILTAMFDAGLFDHPTTGDQSTDVATPAHRQLARRLSEQGTVLLKNEGELLPLDPRRVNSLAVIGDAAQAGARFGGDGSAAVLASRRVSPLEGLTARAGKDLRVTYQQGTLGLAALPLVPTTALTPSSGSGTGLLATYYASPDFTGTPSSTKVEPTLDFTTPLTLGPKVQWSARWTGTLRPPRTGTYRFSLSGAGTARLWINGQQVARLSEGGEWVGNGLIDLVGGTPVSIRVDYVSVAGALVYPSALHLGWQPEQDVLLRQAVEAARNADVAVVFASDLISEGMDRTTLALPGDQDTLIRAVAAANPRTVVVLNTGAAVLMPWLEQVAGVLEVWYPGQEYGHALAAVLFGDVNPSGKLPHTFPARDGQGPIQDASQFPGDGTAVHYDEELLVGYRWYDATGQQPLFPFGHGLSYTSFRYDGLEVKRNGEELAVTVRVTNTGKRAGAEVVQLYVESPAAAKAPPRQLKGFEKVSLAPGESTTVTLTLEDEALASWDTQARRWSRHAGTYTLLVGSSSRDIRAQARFTP
jgi:beta-glucosidase